MIASTWSAIVRLSSPPSTVSAASSARLRLLLLRLRASAVAAVPAVSAARSRRRRCPPASVSEAAARRAPTADDRARIRSRIAARPAAGRLLVVVLVILASLSLTCDTRDRVKLSRVSLEGSRLKIWRGLRERQGRMPCPCKRSCPQEGGADAEASRSKEVFEFLKVHRGPLTRRVSLCRALSSFGLI